MDYFAIQSSRLVGPHRWMAKVVAGPHLDVDMVKVEHACISYERVIFHFYICTISREIFKTEYYVRSI